MEFVVLGSLEVVADPPVQVRGPQLRRLLAVLIADADRVVSTDRLRDVVFDGQPSEAAATTLRSYIARLRRLLTEDGTGARIETVQPGYRLALGSATVDASMFEAEVAAARRSAAAGELATALERLDTALSRWRGTPYAEFADEEWVRPEVARLSELRLGATELRLELLVEAGDHDLALGDVRALAESSPLREPPWRTWVLALYRSGRQAEALRVAAGFRRQLGDLGLDPSPEFAALEYRVAAHDPEIRQATPPRRRLRGYLLLDELGRGRHGVVHRAIQPAVGREVALRTLGVEVADHPTFIRTFDALVRRLAQLEHPHVVPILDFWREPAAAHLASRLLMGGTLTDVLDKGPAPADQVARIVEQVSAGLHAAHRAGLTHGMLTPPEILFDDQGHAYVDGIAVARALDQLLDVEPPPSPYQPPLGAEDGATGDQYALAAIVYQALAGFPPSGRSRGDHFPPVSEFRPELLAVDAVLARAGAPVPDDRYPDVVAFARALSSAVGRTHSALAPNSMTPTNPYKGLRPFDEADADDFFGRRRSIADLLELLAADTDRARVITIVGPSGSGKSSLVRAGLLPRLRAGAVPGSSDWFVATMLPGASPFASLRDALVLIASGPSAASLDPGADGIAASIHQALAPGGQLLLVIDQLEELFTLTSDDRIRSSFIHQLASVMAEVSSPLRIVATLRADCYDLPLADHLLGDLVSAGTVPIPAMSPAELEQAVVGPAARVGVIVEGDLATQLVTEVVNQPGSLPLLQEANRIYDAIATRRALLEALVGGTPPTRTVIPTPASAYAALALAPDGRVAVAKRDDGTLDVIDLESRAVRHAGLAAPARIAEGVDIDPSSSLVASAGLASAGPVVVVYDLDTGRRVTDIAGPAGEIHGVRFTPDGVVLAVSDSHGRITLHHQVTGEVLTIVDLGVDQVVTSFSFTAEGDTLVAVTAPIGQDESSAPAQLHRFDVATGRVDSVELDPTLAGSAGLVEPEGLVLVADTRIATFDLDSLEPVGEPFAGTDVFYSSLAASPDGSAIAAGGWVDLDLLALTDNSIEPLPGPSSAAAAGVAFLPGGDQLITADADGTVSTWTLHWDTELGTPLEPSGPGHVTLAPDGGTLATWGLGRGVRLYDTGTLRQRVALDLDDEQSILGVTFDPDSHRIAVLSCPFGSDPCPASLTLFDVGTGARQRGPVTVGDVWAGLFEGVDFTGDGGHLVTAGPSIRLWDAEHLQSVAEPFTLGDDARLPDAEVRQLRTTLVDGRSLVVGGGELGGAAVWEITDQGVKRLGDLGGNAAVGFTADGELITATGPGSFQLRDPFHLRPLDGPFISDHQAVRYHSTSDGLLVASGPWGAQLWDIPSRQQLSGVVPSASAVAASDGSTVYLGGFGFPGGLAGDQIRAVDLSADHLRERACGQAGRDLTSSEAALYLPASAPDRAICPITSRTR